VRQGESNSHLVRQRRITPNDHSSALACASVIKPTSELDKGIFGKGLYRGNKY